MGLIDDAAGLVLPSPGSAGGDLGGTGCSDWSAWTMRLPPATRMRSGVAGARGGLSYRSMEGSGCFGVAYTPVEGRPSAWPAGTSAGCTAIVRLQNCRGGPLETSSRLLYRGEIVRDRPRWRRSMRGNACDPFPVGYAAARSPRHEDARRCSMIPRPDAEGMVRGTMDEPGDGVVGGRRQGSREPAPCDTPGRNIISENEQRCAIEDCG